MGKAYLNRIETAVPPHDIHNRFTTFAPRLLDDERSRRAFERMAKRAQISHRYSCLEPDEGVQGIDRDGFYKPGHFPDTARRMDFYRCQALPLACKVLDRLDIQEHQTGITHLIVTTCTGFFAPGLDLEIIARYGLNPSVERTIVGFMGCHAAIHALKLARHIVRSETSAKVLVINLELCTLHLRQPENVEQLLSFLLFGDGCAASLVSAEPSGLELEDFHSAVFPDSEDLITWEIGRSGFEMFLSGKVPQTIAANLPAFLEKTAGVGSPDTPLWAVHPGGRSVLDAVQGAAGLSAAQMAFSRHVLEHYGNMSSPSIMFVLARMLNDQQCAGPGFAMAFGPGLSVEAMRFATVGR